MAERVTGPLGLEDTGYMVAEGSRDRLVPAFGTQSLGRHSWCSAKVRRS